MARKYRTPNTRDHQRIDADYLIKYQIKKDGETKITNVKDIGAGGLQFVAQEELPVWANLNLKILVPPLGRTVEAKARIIRTERTSRHGTTYSVAVRFTDIPDADRKSLDAFIKTLEDDPEAMIEIDHADFFVRKKKR